MKERGKHLRDEAVVPAQFATDLFSNKLLTIYFVYFCTYHTIKAISQPSFNCVQNAKDYLELVKLKNQVHPFCINN